LAGFLPVDAFYICIYDPATNELPLSLWVDEGEEELSTEAMPLSPNSLTASIVNSRKPLLFTNLARYELDSSLQPESFGNVERASASWLGVPLLVADSEVLGVISVQSYTPNLYDEREQALLTTVANQLALGVRNAQLLTQARHQVDQLRLLNDVSLAAASTMEHGQIYQAVINALARTTGVDQARLVIYDRPSGYATIVAEYVPTDVPGAVRIQLNDNPAVDWLDTHKQPLVAHDAQNDPRTVVSHEVFRILDIRSIALVPLITGDEVIAAVGLDFVGRSGYFSSEQIELCQTVANQTATALVNARLFAEVQANAHALQGKVSELYTLLEAARTLSSVVLPEQVLDKLTDLVSRQLNVSTVALWIIEGDGMMTLAAVAGMNGSALSPMQVPVGRGLIGRVAQTQLPLIVEDVDEEAGVADFDFQHRDRLVSFMGVPVVYQEKVIGVLSVMTDERRRFTPDEMLLLVGLADQAAAALQNARLFAERERRIRELTIINQSSAATNATLDLGAILEQLHGSIGQIIDTSTSMIVLYDEANNLFTYPICYDDGKKMTYRASPPAGGTNDWVLRHRQPLLLHNFEEAVAMGLNTLVGRQGRDDQVEQSFLVAPLIFNEKVLGIINIQSYEVNAFDDNDLRFLTTIANQAAVAINNALLLNEASQHASEMSTLFEETRHLAGTLDADKAHRLVAQAALRLTGADFCAVLRLDSRGRVVQQVMADRDGLRPDASVKLRDDGLNAQLLRSGGPLAVSDLRETQKPNPQALKLGIRGMLGVLIGSPEERLGVIWVGMRQPHEWQERQTSILSILANQASQTLKSAFLFQVEQGRRRMADTMREVAQKFTSILSESEIQTLVLDQLTEIVPYDSAAILLRASDYDYLHITEARGLDPLRMSTTRVDLSSSELFRNLATSRKPLVISNVLKDGRFAQLAHMGWDVRSWIAAPLLQGGELLGVLAVGSQTSGEYDQEAADVTFTLASQASQAFQNARLFGQISNLVADLDQRVKERTADLESAKAQLEEVAEVLVKYQRANHHLPCPAPLNQLPDSINFGVEGINCHLGGAIAGTSRIDLGGGVFARAGTLPLRTLGLESGFGGDKW
ncbi:MAG: GAF domain-containing protein, partial [Chloroflexaceae bacterium]|nr:GAF domain-containing protein [Chloroflexaceae bacterium]